jgi:prepilin-type N-terminal cleavage/methylation domain-containing protein
MSMSTKRGFTVVEVVVAAAVMVLLISAALPRFVAYSRIQDFSQAATGLLQCVREGQATAVAPGQANGRYIAVVIRQADEPSCQILALESQAISEDYIKLQNDLQTTGRSASLVSETELSPDATVYGAHLIDHALLQPDQEPTWRFENALDGEISLAILFDRAAGGSPLGVCLKQTGTIYPDTDTKGILRCHEPGAPGFLSPDLAGKSISLLLEGNEKGQTARIRLSSSGSMAQYEVQ